MIGYLGRMLQATVGSEHRLHPFAGSVYGERDTAAEQSLGPNVGEPHGTGEDQEPPESERRVVSRRPAAQVATTQAPEPMAFLEQYEPLQPRQREPEAHRPGSAELRSPARADLAAPRERDAVRAIDKRREKSGSTRRMREGGDVDRDAAPVGGGLNLADTASKAVAVKTHGELIPRKAARTIASGMQPWQAARRQNTPPHEPARNMRTAEPEVQVHIGRVEVLAVQPPAPAAPAPRRERTTSLADYLAGPNGRGQ